MPFFNADRFERRRGRLRIKVRSGFAVGDLHVGSQQPVSVFVCEQQDGLGHVPNGALGQARLILFNQGNDVAAGYVTKINDDEAGPIGGQPNVDDLPGRDRGPHSPAVQQVRKRQIVDVARSAGDFVSTLFAEHIAANDAPASGA